MELNIRKTSSFFLIFVFHRRWFLCRQCSWKVVASFQKATAKVNNQDRDGPFEIVSTTTDRAGQRAFYGSNHRPKVFERHPISEKK